MFSVKLLKTLASPGTTWRMEQSLVCVCTVMIKAPVEVASERWLLSRSHLQFWGKRKPRWEFEINQRKRLGSAQHCSPQRFPGAVLQHAEITGCKDPGAGYLRRYLRLILETPKCILIGLNSVQRSFIQKTPVFKIQSSIMSPFILSPLSAKWALFH